MKFSLKATPISAIPFSALAASLAFFSGVTACHGAPNIQPPPVKWDTRPDTWLATDALNRNLPIAPQVSAPRRDKWVGIFYSPWLGDSGDEGPYDVSKILARYPDAMRDWNHPAWRGGVGTSHHWGESVFGYYRSNDEWVLRKHAQMLSDAGVDCVVFDVTNQLTYPRNYRALCRVWSQVRREGGKTPQIVFLCPFWAPAQVVNTLYRDFYSKNLYAELWFRWNGKPLIMANPDLLTTLVSPRLSRVPSALEEGAPLSQRFSADAPFSAIGARLATYNQTRSRATLSLYRVPKNGARVLMASRRDALLKDNQWAMLSLQKPLPAGRYELEISEPRGPVAWWSYAIGDGRVPAAGAERSLRLLESGGKERIFSDELSLAEAPRERGAVPLEEGETLGQSFRATAPFSAVGLEVPTFYTSGSAMTLSLREGGPDGKVLAQKRFTDIRDNSTALLELAAPLAAGTYYLEASQVQGRIGWWSEVADVDAFGTAYENGRPVSGDREVRLSYTQTNVSTLRDFFTFRAPRPDYFGGPNGGKAGEWGWLDVSPQKLYPRPDGSGKIEQVTVGVAQNAVDGNLSFLSNPRAHGRSFHNGVQPGPEGQDFSGKNFQEQWDYALRVDPDFVYVTGWNEWIAGRYDKTFPMYGAGEVNFVDQFNREYSRDIEPMKGGHGDAFYYQLVANVRRFKGARPPMPLEAPRKISIDGNFGDWKGVTSTYRDDRFDTMHRNHAQWGHNGNYVNTTGRNDFVETKVARDAQNFYFYARCEKPIVGGKDAMQLALNFGSAKNWLGYDVLVNRVVPANLQTAQNVSVERSLGGWKWRKIGSVSTQVRGREMEIAVPRALLQNAASFSFKWMDNVNAQANALNFYTNGDSAPNGRFRYAYRAR